ncbi:FKBP-type peptidyl-prolyl cis-trans isomerase SlyD [Thalassocella blandensis]|nr:FKBP-type peptidyl-prolyl cis-trans isomerase SlyD [Thalassocella blandensis]
MKIAQDAVVMFHYSLSEQDGSEIENNRDAMPMAYLHGHKNIMPALEKALDGKEAGEVIDVTVEPKDAYGERKEGNNQKIPVKHLLSKHKRLMPGMLVKVNTEKGPVDARVIKPGKFMVELDFNHPLAGKTLNFHIDIKEVREATSEELAHGHAHGVGGHHH